MTTKTTATKKNLASHVTPERMLGLKTVSKTGLAHNGFQWPKSGHVEAPDWDGGKEVCGGGLHFLPWGIGDGGLLSWEPDARWLIIEVCTEHVKGKPHVEFGGKSKARCCNVVHCGDRKSATEFLFAHKAGLQGVVGAFVTAGDSGTATAGDRGTATAGDRGTATAGDRGTATAGDEGTLIIRWWDGNRYRVSVAVAGEKGIEPNTKYRLNDKGEFIKAD